MTATIKCDKCGRESNNKYVFGNKVFKYINADGYLKTKHLCATCQAELTECVRSAISEFVGEDVRDWDERVEII